MYESTKDNRAIQTYRCLQRLVMSRMRRESTTEDIRSFFHSEPRASSGHDVPEKALARENVRDNERR